MMSSSAIGIRGLLGPNLTKPIASLLLAGLLSGCGTDPTLGPFDEQQLAAARQAKQAEAEAARRNQPGPAQGGAPVVLPQAPPPEPEPKVVNLPPLELLGMSHDNVLLNLGQPVFQRRDKNALLLRYRQRGCILDLFLYPDQQGGPAQSVDYLETRSPGGKKIDSGPCIETIRKARLAG